MGGQAERDEFSEIVRRLSGGQLFATAEEAQAALRDRFMLGKGAPPQEILADNQEIYTSLAELSGQSLQYLDRLKHPLCLLLDELVKAGGAPSMTKPELFACMGINLKQLPVLTGQLGALAAWNCPPYLNPIPSWPNRRTGGKGP